MTTLIELAREAEQSGAHTWGEFFAPMANAANEAQAELDDIERRVNGFIRGGVAFIEGVPESACPDDCDPHAWALAWRTAESAAFTGAMRAKAHGHIYAPGQAA
tara:strand:- start:703 stop:1014 length:312 start_codon:yes stop_codon:yes gene_type:complete